MHVAILYTIIFFLTGFLTASIFSIKSLLSRCDYYENLFTDLRSNADLYMNSLTGLTETNILYDNDEVKSLIKSTNNFIDFLDGYEWIKEEEN